MTPVPLDGCDLRLMLVDTADSLVNEGRNLVIVARVGTQLHIRIFDAHGKSIVDKAENQLISGETLTTLKQQLNSLSDEPDLSPEQKQKIIRDVVSIAGHTPLDQINLHWRQHNEALWWLALLYRRPTQFQKALQALPWRRALRAAVMLNLHFFPYFLLLSLVGYALLFKLPNLVNYVLLFKLPTTELKESSITLWLKMIFDSNWFRFIMEIAFGITFGIAYGIACGITVGIFIGIIAGIAVSTTIGILIWIALWASFWLYAFSLFAQVGLEINAAFTIAFISGISVWFAAGAAAVITNGIAPQVAAGMIIQIIILVAGGITVWIVVWSASGIVGGITFGIALGVAVLRAYYYFFQFFFIWSAPHGQRYLHHPVAWDDLCLLPFPRLDRLLAAYAEHNPIAGQQEIERLIDHYPSQRMVALRARTRMIARDAAREMQLSRLDAIVARLPEGDKGFLTWTPKVRDPVGEVAQLQRRLDTQDRPFLREPTAALLCEKIKNFQSQVSGFPAPLSEEFRQATSQWLALAEQQHRQTKAVLAREPTPQVFRAGDPVDRRQEAFVPRERVLGELDRQLTLSAGCPGLILYGRRRMGKSTLLRNLDGFLPTSVQVVNVSMQAARAFTSMELLLDSIIQKVRDAWPEPERPAAKPTDLIGFFEFLDDCNQRLETQKKRLLPRPGRIRIPRLQAR